MVVKVTPDEYAIMHENLLSITPNIKGLVSVRPNKGLVREKGRKKNLEVRNLLTGKYEKIERTLDKDEYKSFAEISLRAAKCPLPLNLDVWDGLKCPFQCAYCYADYFRASLYTSFFDNANELGLRAINPQKAIERLDKALNGRPADIAPDVKRAIEFRIPLRFGIRFEDFTYAEKRKGISLEIMRYLNDVEYPFMINTKSTLLAEEPYINELNERTAIHITLITLNEKVSKAIERGAPNPKERLKAMEELANVTTVVARIEPYMVGINSDPEELEKYAGTLKDIGVDRITWDTYSYSANNVTIARNFEIAGFNWEWMFDMTSEWQPLGSIMMEGAMSIFRKEGIKCATFDFGCVPTNDFNICCCVDDVEGFQNFNRYNVLSATRFIIKRGKPTTFRDFVRWAGEPLNSEIKEEVEKMWNLGGTPWDIDYVAGIKAVGTDSDGFLIYRYDGSDYRLKIKEVLLDAVGK